MSIPAGRLLRWDLPRPIVLLSQVDSGVARELLITESFTYRVSKLVEEIQLTIA